MPHLQKIIAIKKLGLQAIPSEPEIKGLKYLNIISCNTCVAIITARIAKRAKVMFSQACVTHSVQWGEGGRCCNTKGLWTTPPSPRPGGQHLPPRTQHLLPQDTTPPSPLSPPPRARWTTPPPWTRWTTPPPPPDQVDNTSLPLDQVDNTFPALDQVDNTSLPPPRTMCRWMVRILLECILVSMVYLSTMSTKKSFFVGGL